MKINKNIKQRNNSIQGLRSFKDALPTKVKRIIINKGDIYSKTLDNWKYLVGDKLFKVCYPKSFKNSNRFGVSTLLVMVKRGHEVDLEYSKKNIIDRMNNHFGYTVVEKIKFMSFDDENLKITKESSERNNVPNDRFHKKINDVKNEKIKKSLIELSKVFKEK